MKALTPVRPQKDSSNCSEFALRCLSEHSLNIARCKMEEEDLFCLQYDMNDCYSRLKRLVPTIPQDKKQHGTCPSASNRTPLTVLNTEQATSIVKKQEDSILCR
ncbi:hypothetical protein COCON_G00011640 [Conger conger]|uniref:DNA-binding protein inhibitor ID-4 n=1 Tax=Conger conger TaxID=82655 RepID=A0A9Q1E2M5_CONCO|nr:hypothetical protein COCON_G00011640 [Conger conger]